MAKAIPKYSPQYLPSKNSGAVLAPNPGSVGVRAPTNLLSTSTQAKVQELKTAANLDRQRAEMTGSAYGLKISEMKTEAALALQRSRLRVSPWSIAGQLLRFTSQAIDTGITVANAIERVQLAGMANDLASAQADFNMSLHKALSDKHTPPAGMNIEDWQASVQLEMSKMADDVARLHGLDKNKTAMDSFTQWAQGVFASKFNSWRSADTSRHIQVEKLRLNNNLDELKRQIIENPDQSGKLLLAAKDLLKSAADNGIILAEQVPVLENQWVGEIQTAQIKQVIDSKDEPAIKELAGVLSSDSDFSRTFPGVDIEQRPTLLNQAESALKVFETQRQRAAAEAERAVKQEFADIKRDIPGWEAYLVQFGTEPTDRNPIERLTRLGTPEALELRDQLITEKGVIVQARTVYEGFKDQPFGEQLDRAEILAPKPGDDPDIISAKNKAYQAVVGQILQDAKQYGKDPAGYVQPQVAGRLAAEPEAVDSFERRLQVTEDIQKEKGSLPGDIKYLTEPQKAQLKDALETAPAADRVAVLAELQQKSGRFFGKIMAELDLPSTTRYALALAPENPRLAEHLIQLITRKQGDWQYTPEKAADVKAEVLTQANNSDRYQVLQERAQAQPQNHSLVEDLEAHKYMANLLALDHVSLGEQTPSRAVRQALNELDGQGDFVIQNDRAALEIPAGVQPEAVERGLEAARAQLPSRLLGLSEMFKEGPALFDQYVKDAQDGIFLNHGTEPNTVILVHPVTREAVPGLSWTFDDLQIIAQQAPADLPGYGQMTENWKKIYAPTQ